MERWGAEGEGGSVAALCVCVQSSWRIVYRYSGKARKREQERMYLFTLPHAPAKIQLGDSSCLLGRPCRCKAGGYAL